ncbi:MAG: hypothetical protein L0H94_10010 [Nitrospira sp.]|nr:hypothetical protein [Nitrospira sp.]
MKREAYLVSGLGRVTNDERRTTLMSGEVCQESAFSGAFERNNLRPGEEIVS